MKLIDTSVITPSAGYPGLGNNASVMVGLDFLQQAALDNAAALSQSVASDITQATILFGCVLTSGNISAGWVYFGGEIFQVPAVTVGTAPVGHPFLNASWAANPTDTLTNQTVLSDGTPVSMHNQRTIGFTWSNSFNAGSLPDFQQWIPTRMVTDEASIDTINSEITTINSTLSTQAGEITSINSEIVSINTELGTQTTEIAANTAAISANTAAITALEEPVGTIKMYGGTITGLFDSSGLGISTWTKWALCNGNNGTPNLRGKFIAGYDDSGSDADYTPIGQTGGETTHLLTISEMPSHTHTVGQAVHAAIGTDELTIDGAGSPTGGINNTGGGGAHENRPPYYALAYVMKIV